MRPGCSATYAFAQPEELPPESASAVSSSAVLRTKAGNNHSLERTKMANRKTLRVVTDEDLNSVSGGLLWVHVARTAAVIVAGAVTVIREATKAEEPLVPDLSQVMK
jgi:hypothetical protein